MERVSCAGHRTFFVRPEIHEFTWLSQSDVLMAAYSSPPAACQNDPAWYRLDYDNEHPHAHPPKTISPFV
jgi:hypothetical protein